jgi:stress response protein YsnF
MTYTIDEMRGWIGHNLVDAEGAKIGRIEDLYADERTGQPEWLAVTTGWFGSNISFVPLAGATRSGDDLSVPYGKDQVKNAPNIDPTGRLSEQEEARLYRHYGRDYDETWTGETDRERARTNASTDEAMTRSEEEMRVGVQKEEAGRVRLRKWVETELVQQTVPVKREKARLEREPITDENIDEAMSGPDLSEDEHEVILHEERPVVTTETVPKERVRVTKDTEVVEQPVEAEVRKERIEADGEVDRR